LRFRLKFVQLFVPGGKVSICRCINKVVSHIVKVFKIPFIVSFGNFKVEVIDIVLVRTHVVHLVVVGCLLSGVSQQADLVPHFGPVITSFVEIKMTILDGAMFQVAFVKVRLELVHVFQELPLFLKLPIAFIVVNVLVVLVGVIFHNREGGEVFTWGLELELEGSETIL